MALANASVVLTALQNLYAAFVVDKTERGARSAVLKLGELSGYLNFLFGTVVDIALTADQDDADVTAFVAAEATISAKTIFRVTTDTYDFTDNALGTARDLVETGTDDDVVAAGDVYAVTDAGTGVVFLGKTPTSVEYGVAFDMVGESAKDFISIGS